METLVISKIALFWCICAAPSLTYNTIKPGSFNEKWSNYSLTRWAMLIGGIICNIITPVWHFSGSFDTWAIINLLAVIILGILLNISFEFLDWAGTTLIVSMVIILSLKKK